MSADYARDQWERALNSLRSAEALLTVSPDDAASRAYYAAFHLFRRRSQSPAAPFGATPPCARPCTMIG